jgi:sterol desaturase/sphingolipid hydroxylase (fatty acid hydroxylase superfamily)
LATGPFLLFFDMWLHANVVWPGRARRLARLVATPGLHRWHHAAPELLASISPGPRGCNFAGVFPIWDLLFGTFFLPASAPTAFGTGDPVPATLLGQLATPVASIGRALQT